MRVTQQTLISDAIKEAPKAKKIINKYFQGACFNCPSFQIETIAEAAMMHNVDAEKIVKEINELKAGG